MRKIEKVKELTLKEIKKLGSVLYTFIKQTTRDTGVGKISGGFVLSQLFNYDDDYIDIQLKWGIKSDCQDTCNVEDWKLKRSVLSSKKSIKKMVEEIEN
jgi:hypothetical protein